MSVPQMDIEIYVQNVPSERIVGWITSVLGPLTPVEQDSEMSIFQVVLGRRRVPITITNNVHKDLTSVWFNSPDTPWESDLACARQAVHDLGCVAYCSVPDDDLRKAPGMFLRFAGDQESIVSLRD